MVEHSYEVKINWTGNTGEGTSSYEFYSRDHTISVKGKPTLELSSDPSFLGDETKYNPEELLVSAISGCYMLWYLHLCANNNITVTSYTDHAAGTMGGDSQGMQFTNVQLHPEVEILEEGLEPKASQLHAQAHDKCFIARSMNFPVGHTPSTNVAKRK